jgi:hypothetical protein
MWDRGDKSPLAPTDPLVAYTYLWSTGDTTQAATATTANNPISVIVTDVNGCSDTSATAIVTESSALSLNLGLDTTLCKNYGDSIILNAGTTGSYIWSDNSNAQTLTVNSSTLALGTYNYGVTVTQGACTGTDTIAITVDICNMGIAKTNSNEVSLYPNPTESVFTVTTASLAKQTLEVTNSLGQVIYKGEFIAKQIVDLREFATGVYTVKVSSNENATYHKVVKQ